ncbi:MAG: alpha/beta hydrolase [Chitinophagaceae bacterium]|nr:alpha/beta hydrolase [Chitinophagaceae bacterium]MCW5927617.1 alpha/beta hydrolase [Chitinophagaceae bacterium]
MELRHLQYDNTPVSYRIADNKTLPAVMLIHGFGEDGSIWENQVALLCDDFRLIVPDIPGSGDSPCLEIAGDQQIMDVYADILLNILRKEEITNCTLIGHSMGGYIALSFLRHYEELTNGLGLVHSTAFADSGERIEMRKKGITFIQKFGAHDFLKQSIPNLFAAPFTTAHREFIEKLIEKAADFSDKALIQYYRAMIARPDSTDILEKYRKPVLFIIGEEDKSVYLQDSLKQCHIPKISHIKILPNAAHMGMWEAKDQVNLYLEEYLKIIVDGC